MKFHHFFILLFYAFSLFGQINILKSGDKNFNSGSFLKAIEKYEAGLKETSLHQEDILTYKVKLGNTYKKIKDYKQAERIYKELVTVELPERYHSVYQSLAQVLAANGNYEGSQDYFRKYNLLKTGQDPFVAKTIKLYEDGFELLNKNASSYLIEYLGINTNMSEFSPIKYKNGLVFATSRIFGNAIKRYSEIDNAPFLDLYFLESTDVFKNKTRAGAIGSSRSFTSITGNYTSKPLGRDAYTPATANDSKVVGFTGGGDVNGNIALEELATISSDAFSKDLNSKFHDGPVSFFSDFSKVIFTRNSREKGSDGFFKLKLFIADFEGSDWKNIKELPFNSPEYSTAHPSISYDNQVLYFSSNMPGGFGGSDLYICRYNGGSWSQPINLGPKVNTNADEVFPFIDANSNLYFSSNGHAGLGELDIFVVQTSLKDGLPKSKIANLGAPLNSSKDDFGLYTDGERKEGYFSSNRKRGGSDDDIYGFQRVGPIDACNQATIVIKDNETKIGLPFVKLTIEQKSKGSLQTIYADAKGTNTICLLPDSEYWISAETDGYTLETKKLTTFNSEEGETLELDLKKKIYLEKQLVPQIKKEEPVFASSKVSIPVVVPTYSSIDYEEPLIEDIDTTAFEVLYRGVVTAGADRQPVSGAIVVFRNQCDGTTQRVITKEDGVYQFKRELGCDYAVEIVKEKFDTVEDSFNKVSTKRRPKATAVYGSNIFREGDVVAIDKIYFNSGEQRLKREAKRELDKLVQTLKKYNTMVVEIRSHTDSPGLAQENLRLTQRRASEIASYLFSKGIEPSRILANGYGETQLTNGCKDGVQCAEYEHARNRRTEFKIMSLR